MAFNNGVWVIEKLPTTISEAPFEVFVDGEPKGMTKLLAFARHVPNTDRFPQVLVLYSSGYLRLKAGADPKPPLPFGQSLVLGPAIYGTSTSVPDINLFFNPQLQSVAIDTTQINQDGTNCLLIEITASASKLLPDSKINRIMNLTWRLTLDEPSDQATILDVEGTFEFTEDVLPDPVKTAEAESVRLLQISTMYINSSMHDVDAFRFRNADGVITIYYDPALANKLLPVPPSPLDPETLIFDSLHNDDVGEPNGNTPSYRITIDSTTPPLSGPITHRAFFNSSQNLNHDTLGLWAFQQPPDRIEKGTKGCINYTVIASTDPLPAIALDKDNACRYHDRGRMLANRRQYDEAINQYQKAIKIDDKYVEAYNSWGWALANQGLYDKAIPVFKEAIKINDKYAKAYHSLGLAFANLKQYDEAIGQYQIAINIDDKYVNAFNSWGWALANQGLYDKAVPVFKEAININDKYVEAYHSLGLAFANLKQYDEAIGQYQIAIYIDGNYAEAYNSWGWALVKQKRYKEAITPFSKTIGIRPSYEKYNNLGFVLANLGRYIDAMKLFEKAIKLNKEAPRAYNNKGWMLANQGLYDQAIPLFDKAINIDLNYANAYNNWGWALDNQGLYDQAIPLFDKAITIDPNYANAYNNLGWALANQGHYDEASSKFEKATKIEPEYANAYNNWGWALAHQGHCDEATPKFDTATKIEPEYANAYYNWGWALAHDRRYDEAIKKYQKAIDIDGSVNAYHSYAKALWDQGKYRQGLEKWNETRKVYERMIQKAISDKNSNFFYNYGTMLHEIFGEFEQSKKAYEEGRELNPNDALIYIGLARLCLEEKDVRSVGNYSRATVLKRSSTDPIADAYWHARDAYGQAESLINDPKNKGIENLFVQQQLAQLHLSMKENNKARDILEKILKTNPEYAQGHAGFGTLYMQQKNYKAAIEEFETANSKNPYNLTIRTNLAKANHNDGQLLSAETEYKEILSVAPEHIESHIGLGEVYTAMGDAAVRDSELYELAIWHFHKGIEIATNKTGQRLTTKKLADAYYSLGYARVQLYKISGASRNELFLVDALLDFKNCFKYDQDHCKAKIAQEKLQKRLIQFGLQRFAETITSWIIVLSSMFVFIKIQLHFFEVDKAGAEIIDGNYGYYALLTFGSLLWLVAGLFLPHVLKLKVGAVKWIPKSRQISC